MAMEKYLFSFGMAIKIFTIKLFCSPFIINVFKENDTINYRFTIQTVLGHSFLPIGPTHLGLKFCFKLQRGHLSIKTLSQG
jgi:hypothetical protein